MSTIVYQVSIKREYRLCYDISYMFLELYMCSLVLLTCQVHMLDSVYAMRRMYFHFPPVFLLYKEHV
jgi:hypothetical protein